VSNTVGVGKGGPLGEATSRIPFKVLPETLTGVLASEGPVAVLHGALQRGTGGRSARLDDATGTDTRGGGLVGRRRRLLEVPSPGRVDRGRGLNFLLGLTRLGEVSLGGVIFLVDVVSILNNSLGSRRSSARVPRWGGVTSRPNVV
jgi:hypothetical protein